MTDREIVSMYIDRNEEAITASERKFGAYLISIAMNILGDRRDAEEAINDAYLKAWSTIPPAEPEDLAAYLGKLLRNTAIDVLRKRSAEKRSGELCLIFSELEECVPGGSTPEDALESKTLGEAINDFLGSLTKEKRIIFLRRYWYSDSVREIARSIGRGEAAVGMELKRIRDKLRK